MSRAVIRHYRPAELPADVVETLYNLGDELVLVAVAEHQVDPGQRRDPLALELGVAARDH